MSAREWKPGDVAMVNDTTQPEKPWEPATCHAVRTPERETVWVLHKNGGKVWGSVSQARPLVVIDPEDREAVERFVRLMPAEWSLCGFGESDDAHVLGDSIDGVQAALREFADPKPPACRAELIFKGEHFPCDQHEGHAMTHSNIEAGAIWGERE